MTSSLSAAAPSAAPANRTNSAQVAVPQGDSTLQNSENKNNQDGRIVFIGKVGAALMATNLGWEISRGMKGQRACIKMFNQVANGNNGLTSQEIGEMYTLAKLANDLFRLNQHLS